MKIININSIQGILGSFYNLIITIRTLYRNGIYSFVNVVGLAVSITVVIIIALWVENELTFDRWYSNADNIYLAGVKSKNSAMIRSSGPIVEVLGIEFPEIKRVGRYNKTWGVALFYENENTNGFFDEGAYVDSTILTMLDVKLLQGSIQSVFNSAHPIIICETMSQKMFGDENPMFKTIRISGHKGIYEVTGIFKDMPQNSSFNFNWAIPFEVIIKEGRNDYYAWHTIWIDALVELHQNVDIKDFNEKIKNIEKERSEGNNEVFLYPITKKYLYGEFVDGNPIPSKKITTIKELLFIGLLIVIIACFNFINLATARSEKRIMEMGIRKTFGAKRLNLITQLISESAVMTVASLLLAIVITVYVLPLFNIFLKTELTLNILGIRHIIGIITIGTGCTLFSGIYPAYFISSFNPNDNLKKLKNRASSVAGRMRKILIVLQFAASFILICITLALFLQIMHSQNRQMGYEKENLLRVGRLDNETMQKKVVIKEELINCELIEQISFGQDNMIFIGSRSSGFNWKGIEPDVNPAIYRSYVSPDFIETVGFQLLEGRDFYEADNTDRNSVIINKTLANILGDEGVINSTIWLGAEKTDFYTYNIIGIIDDFVFNDFNNAETKPAMLHKTIDILDFYLYVRFKPDADIVSGLEYVKEIMSKFPTNFPLEYIFIEDDINHYFDQQRQSGIMVALFSILSVLISCLGLFGLVTYIAETKTKEIGIRKVFGAKITTILMMLTKEFFILSAISSLISIPLAYYLINRILEEYSYRISVGWEIFTLVLLLTLLLTILTVGIKALKTAMRNPAEVLSVNN